MNDEETTSVAGHPLQRGITALREFIDAQDTSPNRWAIEHRFDPAQIHQLLRGLRKSVSVDLAARIERATAGAVPSELWKREDDESGEDT